MKAESLVLGLFCISFSGCGSGDASTAALVPNMALTPAQIKSYQVSVTAPCLSIEKAMAAVRAAKQSREMLTDIGVLDDGTAVSEAFGDAVIQSTGLDPKMNPEDPKNSNTWKQSDCHAIQGFDVDGKLDRNLKLKITESSPTMLETQVESLVGPGDKPGLRITFDLVSSRMLIVQVHMPCSAAHEKQSCGIEQENHDVLMTSEVEFADQLGALPYPSPRLARMKRHSADSLKPELADTRKESEQAYCAKVKAKPQASL